MHFPKCVQLLRLSVCYVYVYIYTHVCVCNESWRFDLLADRDDTIIIRKSYRAKVRISSGISRRIDSNET